MAVLQKMGFPRLRRVRVRDLDEAARQELGGKLLDIFMASFEIENPELVVQNVLFRGPGVVLWLLCEADGAVAAFVSCEITTMTTGGRTRGVMSAGMYVRPGLKNHGMALTGLLVAELLQFWSRHPFTPVDYVTEAMSPASYVLGARWPGMSPRPGHPVDDEVSQLVGEFFRAHGRTNIDGDPWLTHVNIPVLIRNPERMRRYVEGSNDPAVQFYVSRNPGYLTGDWLVMHLPCRWRSLVKYGGRVVQDSVRRKLRGKTSRGRTTSA